MNLKILQARENYQLLKKKGLIADINNKFNEEDMEIIKNYNLMAPSELLKLSVAELRDYSEEVKQKSKDIGQKELGPLR